MLQQNRVFYSFFIFFLALISAGFVYLLYPYFSAIFWGIVVAVLFRPLFTKLLSYMPNWRNAAALITIVLVVLLAVIPIIFISASITNEAAGLYKQIQSGSLNFGHYIDQIVASLPRFLQDILERYHIDSYLGLREKILSLANNASRLLANEFLNIGQNAFSFFISVGIMLYLSFFLIRDGEELQKNLKRLIPLSHNHKSHIFEKFITVVRATVKGNILVAMVQGALGGLIFLILGINGALLWAVIMAFLSMLPAVGAAIVWVPVAGYLLASGDYTSGIILILYGALIMGMADNVLRPLLVGKDTKLPDYVILITTIGGITIFGINGFVVGPLLAAIFFAFWAELPDAIRLLDEGDQVAQEYQLENQLAEQKATEKSSQDDKPSSDGQTSATNSATTEEHMVEVLSLKQNPKDKSTT